MVRLFLAAASLVRIEQQLSQGDENDDADERGATHQRTTRGVGLPAGEPVTRNGPLQPPSDPPPHVRNWPQTNGVVMAKKRRESTKQDVRELTSRPLRSRFEASSYSRYSRPSQFGQP
jgi:hypothetical protein